MTEKEKMLNSQMYNPMGDKQLRNERCSVKNLCREYNNLPFEDEETQKILIRKLSAVQRKIPILPLRSGATTATISNSVRISIQTTIW